VKAIGFRADNSEVWWAVVEGTIDDPVLVARDRLRPPKAHGPEERLAWLRRRVLLLIQEYAPDCGGVRFPETTGRGHVRMFPRIRVEGVLVEALASSKLTSLVCGPLKTISSSLDSERAKKYLEEGDLRGIDLQGLPANTQDAVLVAVAALGGS
jgi:hypothetical protein